MMESNQRIIVTKRMLWEGLMRLLKTKTLDKINITELCREAGVNRSTFYRYYELPKDILTEMQTSFFEEMQKRFQTVLTVDDIEQLFVHLAENVELVKLFLQYNSDAEWIDIINHFYQSYQSEGNKRTLKAFRGLDEDSSKLLFTYFTGGAYFVVRQWVMEDIPKTPKEVTEIMLSQFNKDMIF